MTDFTFPHPLRLAVGSHQRGSGRGCAMNVISYENGDAEITDMPACAAQPLARLVQQVNDSICTHRDGDLLCPACSVTVLGLAHRTVGTAAATEAQVWAWLAELLDSPTWGCVRFTDERGAAAITAVADLCRRAADGQPPSRDEWAAAGAAAWAAAGAAAWDAARAAAWDAARDAARAAAWDAARDAALLEHANAAIDAWERITGRGAPAVDDDTVNTAVARMLEAQA